MQAHSTNYLAVPESIRTNECKPGDYIEFRGWPLIVERHIQDGDYRGIYAVDESCEDDEGRPVGMEIPYGEYVSLFYRRGGAA